MCPPPSRWGIGRSNADRHGLAGAQSAAGMRYLGLLRMSRLHRLLALPAISCRSASMQ